ncbi:MAG: HTH-type transcriptional repressor FabR [Pseudomonadales bacterium]|uniref:HTH-type transcriptional repressor FabR n=1 Tax=unclassified Ketobacter TaxID=2639109 RepID=UPI000C5C355F|nr:MULTISPECIES: HTH-type transcriptional repressor FabR [unclassified Ketobacter]MAQ27205.1 HTH-type transcriptional repressor FabR [Pseudomonadales bacterium]MEC8813606.1 HTH-type transcriptional repressor FabR [Pseudomonadota bacterium]HAG94044.1 HTH-type transcriptional repressor FabR [Gammaproteobacteria bacterium]MBI27038.1 HTH-type transcriptional repressor FabR [Pseudomonadales bacterium]MCK5790436.1 HTH-type transcriptional repressor FabR [Ketobacter sp.]|tara:strand:+ start:2876 stop:3505 length:630 start_codon:yes stop_codon:yes gene_type:complete
MNNRQERKLLTRQSLMNAALQWVEEGQHFSSLSIREVAKRAGVVPTAFYRHFKDLDDLALNLVDELSLVLRQLMREVRQNRVNPQHIIRDSVQQYCQYVVSQRVFFIFMSQSMTGGTALIRQAVRSELQYFAKELVADLQRFSLLPNLDPAMMDVLADLTISTMAFATVQLLDLSDASTQSRQDFENKMSRQLQLIYVGAANWKRKEPL